MDFQINRIFHNYTVGDAVLEKNIFIPNINEIYVVNILNQLIDYDNSTSIDVHLSNVKSYVMIGYNEDED